MQIYKDMNIGTAKVTKEEQEKYPHALIDIVSPNVEFSVSDYVKLCKQEIEKARKLNKLPIIVGGTGLYVKALLEGYSLGTTANNEFREKYQKLAEINGKEYVWNILNEINPEKAKTVHFTPEQLNEVTSTFSAGNYQYPVPFPTKNNDPTLSREPGFSMKRLK
jgi:tRNA dimethylallyltransferase